MDDTQQQRLDLTAYPKIIPADPQLERERNSRRSTALQAVKRIAANLFKAIEVYISEFDDMDAKMMALESQKEELAEVERQLQIERGQLEQKEKYLKSEQEYITAWGKAHMG